MARSFKRATTRRVSFEVALYNPKQPTRTENHRTKQWKFLLPEGLRTSPEDAAFGKEDCKVRFILPILLPNQRMALPPWGVIECSREEGPCMCVCVCV